MTVYWLGSTNLIEVALATRVSTTVMLAGLETVYVLAVTDTTASTAVRTTAVSDSTVSSTLSISL